MYLVVIAWLYVALMMALAEATHARGSVLGAVFTFLLYGVAPVALLTYLMGRPARRAARQRREAQAEAAGRKHPCRCAPMGLPPGVLQPRHPPAHRDRAACLAAAACRLAYSGSIGKEELTMSEDSNKMAGDPLLIHLEPDWERRNWSRWLNCSEPELLHAVESVRADPDNVRRFLRQAR